MSTIISATSIQNFLQKNMGARAWLPPPPKSAPVLYCLPLGSYMRPPLFNRNY